MPLDPLKLDDIDWRTLVDSIRRRIAAASRGEWTLHSPVDPGVTLLELYAWLIEQRIFWLDQVPDSLVRASLRLLGANEAGTSAARTVLRVARAAAPLGWLPRRARFELEDSDPPLLFTTLDKAAVLDVVTTNAGDPVVEVSARTGASTQTLSPLAALPLFSTSGTSGEVRIDLRLRAPPSNAHAAFHVLIDLDVSPHLAAQWHPTDVRNAPPASTLRWWLSTNGGRRELSAQQLRDGTHGLRRPGLIAIDPTALADWQPESTTRPDTYSIWITADAPRFVYPPRLRAVIPNVVIAEHRRRASSALTQLDLLPLPSRQLPLDETCVADGDGPLESSAQAQLLEKDGKVHTWRAVRDVTFHAGDARVFVVERDQRRFVFGDGYRGRLPNLAAGPNSRTCVWLGGGPRGNVGAARYWHRLGPTPVAAHGAFNVVPGVGGRAAQTIAEARSNATAKLRQITRAVTPDDFKNLAETTPGVDVARAHAAVGHHPCHVCPVAGAVTVFVLPWAPRDESIPREQMVAAPVADAGMLTAVRTRLDHARLVGSEVFVRPVPLRAVSLRLDLEGETLGLAAVQGRIEARLRRFLDPLGGGDSSTWWPFGAPLRPSLLLREAQQAIGRGLTARRMAVGLDGAAPDEDCSDVQIGPNALPWLASIDFTITAAPLTGGLR